MSNEAKKTYKKLKTVKRPLAQKFHEYNGTTKESFTTGYKLENGNLLIIEVAASKGVDKETKKPIIWASITELKPNEL